MTGIPSHRNAATVPGPDLATSVHAALAAAAAGDPADVRSHLVLEAHLPAGPASSGPVRELLTRRGPVVLGSRGPTQAPSRLPALYLSATPEAWEATAAWFERYPTPRRLVGFTLARADLRTVPDPVEGKWEATLHPDVAASTNGAAVAAGEAEVDAFEAAVERVGGTLHRRYLRAHTLTYAALTLPGDAAAHALAAYNPLRSLCPMPHIGFR